MNKLVVFSLILALTSFSCSSESVDTSKLESPNNAIAPSLKDSNLEQNVPGTEGGVLKRLWSDPPTLDPHLVTDTTSAGLVVEMFSGLVGLNSDLEIVPDLATHIN